MLSIWGGQWVSHSPTFAPIFTLTAPTLAILIILYGFATSALPVWLLLAPRDYLSTFVKLGTIALLVLALVWSLTGMAVAQMPWLAGSGLRQAIFYVVAGMGWVLPAMPIVSWMSRPDRLPNGS